MSNSKRLLLTGGAVSAAARATDLDGANDYLSRSSDFTGNSDSKTFTFSFWLYYSDAATQRYVYDTGTTKFEVKMQGGELKIFGNSVAPAIILNASVGVSNPNGLLDTWTHILISIDLANASNRFIYINDVAVTPTYFDYVDAAINFTNATHSVGSQNGTGGTTLKCRLTDVFLDYTFRDLSVVANRRLFNEIDAEKGLVPVAASSLAALSPIMMAFTNPGDLTENLGTGGAWTQNGVMARSQRGPNQFNAVASEFDGSADYMRVVSIAGVADSKTLTLSFNGRKDSATGTPMRMVGTFPNDIFFMTMEPSATGAALKAFNSAFTKILEVFVPAPGFIQGVINSLSISVDLTDTNKRHIIFNGVDHSLTATWSTYANDFVAFTSAIETYVQAAQSSTLGVPASFKDGEVGEIYFDTDYIDLTTDNPFWDSDLDEPKYLGEMGEIPTGSQPLVYLPVRGDDAGNNLGSGGDFAVFSGPFTGARGRSEFWARGADFNGTTGYLSRTATLTGSSDGKTVNCLIALRPDSVAGTENIFTVVNGANERFAISRSTTNILIEGFNSAGTQILDASAPATLAVDTWAVILFSLDLASSTNRSVFKDGALLGTTWTTFTDDSIELSATEQYIAAGDAGASLYGGDIGAFYLDFGPEIDFNTEANRLLFVDAFNFPVDLPATISAGNIPTPIIHMGFEDTADLGFNSGTGGNFTVNGTVTAGADVNG